jgi:hypothetical protein
MTSIRPLYPRAITDTLLKALKTDNILVLHGARQVGKTSLMSHLLEHLEAEGKSTHFIDLEDSRLAKILDSGVDEFLRHLMEEGFLSEKAKSNPSVFVFIDEIQILKNPSPFLKLMADHHKEVRLIVSGSSSFAIKSKFSDSLAGRTLNFEIFPLSFSEFLTFKGVAKGPEGRLTEKKAGELKALFKEYSLYGGYPKIVLENDLSLKERQLQQLIDTYLKKDIRDLADIRDIDKFNKLLEALASQSGQLLDVTELSNTCNLAKQTVEKYLFILENTYILKRMRPYSRNLRSELFKTPKVIFYDSGLMQMLWLKQLQKEILGPVFETSIFMELIKEHGTENVFFWRTKDQKEIDFIVRSGNRILPVEAKLNFSQASTTALTYFCEKYDLSHHAVVGLNGEPKGKFQHYPWDIPRP